MEGDNIYFSYQDEPTLGLGAVVRSEGRERWQPLEFICGGPCTAVTALLSYFRRCVFNQQTVRALQLPLRNAWFAKRYRTGDTLNM